MKASFEGHIDVVDLLLKQEANIEATNRVRFRFFLVLIVSVGSCEYGYTALTQYS